jgi:hypothetical protein
MKNIALLTLIIALFITQCGDGDKSTQMEMKNTDMAISTKVIKEVTRSLSEKSGNKEKERIEKGVKQAASFWREKDGTANDFKAFCEKNFIQDEKELNMVLHKLSQKFEYLKGFFHRIDVKLQEPLHLDMGEIHPVDMMFGEYNASAHLKTDFFNNKIAFYILLNFPFYSLQEKSTLGKDWSEKGWAMARLADIYTSRVPAELVQKASKMATASDTYISEYNIYMGNLVDENKETMFPKDMKLISHWGLRDELKSNYARKSLKKQKTIYHVMLDIINQEIPAKVINSDEYQWDPKNNKVYKDGKEVELETEPDTRYQHLLNNFQARMEQDPYNPYYDTYIKRAFNKNMEMSQEEVEKLFTDFVSSNQAKKVAQLIRKRLDRDLEPFDIWYDGFKARSSVNEQDLDKITMKKYPTAQAFQKDLPVILQKLGWNENEANRIASKISVDPARGAGHAWGAEMKSDVSHLRTRVSKKGMNYKGYNIAIHEFGHNVEQTITLHDVDQYMLNGVPNTAFTEAIAFLFQKRDLELLGITESNKDKKHLLALDNFWSCYEIMGVSLVDMEVWKWLYENPKADATQLKEAVVRIAKEIWNKYYAEAFGVKDSPILAIYSHMIDAPLYLSAYPIGHLIDFQIEQNITGKNFADEITRMLKQGRLTPQIWMQGAVGNDLSIQPTLDATSEALNYFE